VNESDYTISAVLPVHAGVEPDHLQEALNSLLAQTRPADEVVVVEDGPLSDRHRRILQDLEARHSSVVRIALSRNEGAGVANQAGLEAATGTWIAKVDADDVSVPDRLARQLAEVTASGVDVCGGAMLEFDHALVTPSGLRRRPLAHAAIARLMRFNNPINHPTSFYRRELALEAGGYPPMRYMQDYVLFARMHRAGASMVNTDEVLVHFRAGDGVIARRRAPGLVRLEWELQRELRRLRLIGRVRAVWNLVVRVAYRRMPRTLTRLVHRLALVPAAAPRAGERAERQGR
jgi:glycosyltransferase involved in cell wall biosynthesis